VNEKTLLQKKILKAPEVKKDKRKHKTKGEGKGGARGACITNGRLADSGEQKESPGEGISIGRPLPRECLSRRGKSIHQFTGDPKLSTGMEVIGKQRI